MILVDVFVSRSNFEEVLVDPNPQNLLKLYDECAQGVWSWSPPPPWTSPPPLPAWTSTFTSSHPSTRT